MNIVVLGRFTFPVPTKPNKAQIRALLKLVDQAVAAVNLAPVFNRADPIRVAPGVSVLGDPPGNQRGRKWRRSFKRDWKEEAYRQAIAVAEAECRKWRDRAEAAEAEAFGSRQRIAELEDARHSLKIRNDLLIDALIRKQGHDFAAIIDLDWITGEFHTQLCPTRAFAVESVLGAWVYESEEEDRESHISEVPDGH